MALHYNPRIVTHDLLLALDAGDVNSYPGSGSIWRDISGNGFYADMLGSPVNQLLGGAKCFNFNDIGDRFVVRFGSTQYTNSLTIESWIYPARTELSSGDRGCIFQGYAYQSWNKGSQSLSNYWYGTNNQGYHEAGQIPREEWRHLVSVWDTGKKTLTQYIDAKPFSPIQTYATGGYLYLDCNIGWEGDGRQFAGGISTLRIYKNALTQAEVLQNYTAQKTRHGHAI
jgi:hypothetical protein